MTFQEEDQDRLQILCGLAASQFEAVAKSHFFFHLFFASLIACEIFFLALAYGALGHSLTVAVIIAGLFMTSFSYVILHLYNQVKKPEQLAELRDQFTESCQHLTHYQEGQMLSHLHLGHCLEDLALYLDKREYQFYEAPTRLPFLQAALEKFSCYWHWKDVHQFREMLLFVAIDEHVKRIKLSPMSLEAHAGLAACYVLLSALYADPRGDEDPDLWIPPERLSDTMQEKYRRSAQKAIEEFKILKEYAPDEPWVHEQLASSYRDLQMPDAAIAEYESILKLKPQDRETAFNLGILYMQMGENAKGLKIYQTLKAERFLKADNLLAFYSAHQSLDLEPTCP